MLIVCPSCASRYELDEAKLPEAGRKVRCAACKTLWHVEPPAKLPPPPSAEEIAAELDRELAETGIAAQAETEAPQGEAEAPLAAEAQDSADAEPASEVEPAADTEPVADIAVAPEPPPRPRPGRAAKRRAGSVPAGIAPAARAPLALLACCLLVAIGLVVQRVAVVRLLPQSAGLYAALGLKVNVRGLSLGAVESRFVDEPQGRFLVVEGDITNLRGSAVPVPLIEVGVRDEAGQTLYSWTTQPPRPVLEPAELARFRARLAAPPEAGRSVKVRFADAPPASLASVR